MKEMLIGAFIALVIIAIIIGIGFNLSNNEIKDVQVPNLVGLSLEEARNKVEEIGLILEIEGTGNTVIVQEPLYIDGYTIKSNSTIKVEVGNWVFMN